MTTTREEQDQHIAAWQDSELSQAAYCRSAKIPACRFAYWLKQHRQREQSDSEDLGFLEIQRPEVADGRPDDSSMAIVLFFPSGVQIQVPRSTTPATLRAIVNQVSAC